MKSDVITSSVNATELNPEKYKNFNLQSLDSEMQQFLYENQEKWSKYLFVLYGPSGSGKSTILQNEYCCLQSYFLFVQI